MQFYYGSQNLLRALDEAEFWKHQESEHAGLIPIVTPGLEEEYIHRLEHFSIGFTYIGTKIVRYLESVVRSGGTIGEDICQKIVELVNECVEQSKSFVEFLLELLKNSKAVHHSTASQVVVNHMMRESQYFIGIDQLILQAQNARILPSPQVRSRL